MHGTAPRFILWANSVGYPPLCRSIYGHAYPPITSKSESRNLHFAPHFLLDGITIHPI